MTRIQRVIAAERRALADREDIAVARLQRYHATILDTLYDDLDAITARIETAVRNGEPVNIDWLRRQENYHRLIEQAQAAYAQYEPYVLDEIMAVKRDAVQRGGADALARADAAGLRTSTMYTTLNTEALVALSGQLAPNSPLRGIIGSHGDRAIQIIEDELIRGMGRGSGAESIVREIRRRLGGDADVSRLRALTRTEMMRSYRSSLDAQYSTLGFPYKVWSAAMTTRTCLACLSRHGTEYPIDYVMDSHVNCRCSWVPSRGDGRVQRILGSGEGYLRSLAPSTQMQMIGNADAYALYRDGQIGLDAFVGRQHSDVWGPAIYQKSGARVLRERGA